MNSITEALNHAVERYPSRTAFQCLEEKLTYRDLASKAGQLSNILIGSGVRPGDRVAIYMPRCIESAIAVFGILNAGAAFVPIDPNAPAAAVIALLVDCEISILITVPQMRRLMSRISLPDGGLKTVIGLDSDQLNSVTCIPWADVFIDRNASQTVSIDGSTVAYIIHTSGSTGKPKGIMHSHFSGLSYARLSQQAYQIQPDDVIGSHAPLHTDMSTLGYLTGPYAGATTVIVPENHTRLPASMCALIESQALTIWYSVPLALVQMLETELLGSLNTTKLRWILYGGEPFAPKHLRALSKQLPTASISNVYGPAEVNQCTHFDLPAHDDTENWPLLDNAIPIGRPWPETEALIVDDSDNRTIQGEIGELLISSTTMMKGYWKRPDLNAHAFHQVGELNCERTYYRTGDLVRCDPDGLLWLIGRNDRQVKVRGFRVELDHVELTITNHPEVRETGVFPIFDDGQNTNHLIAAVIATDPKLTPTELKDFARTQLPDAATPQTIVIVDALPRTTSGKIDRTQLQKQWQTKQENE